MERNNTNQPEQPEHPRQPTPEREAYPKLQPKVYAACLAAYNNGFLHGSWIHADQQPDDLMAEIQDMLERSPTQPAEEWAIHDYEDFGAFEPHEYERLDTIARVAGGLAVHGSAFAHWIHEVGSDAEDADETFNDAYRGSYQSYSHLAEQLLDDMGVNPETIIPDWISPYIRIDWDGLGRAIANDYTHAEDHDGTLHLFDAT